MRCYGGNVLTGIHILLTLKCTNECDHCFLHCSPSREATFTIGQLRSLIDQIKQLGTVTIVSPVGGMFSAITVLLAWAFLKEKPSRHQIIGFVAILVGVATLGAFG